MSARIQVFDCVDYLRNVHGESHESDEFKIGYHLAPIEDWVIVATMYIHGHGEPSCIGKEIADTCGSRRVGNGYGAGRNTTNIFNTSRNLAAVLVHAFFENDCADLVQLGFASQKWNYDIYHDNVGMIHVRIYDHRGVGIWDGKVTDLIAYIKDIWIYLEANWQ